MKFENGYVIYPILYWACDYLSILGLKLISVSKIIHRFQDLLCVHSSHYLDKIDVCYKKENNLVINMQTRATSCQQVFKSVNLLAIDWIFLKQT